MFAKISQHPDVAGAATSVGFLIGGVSLSQVNEVLTFIALAVSIVVGLLTIGHRLYTWIKNDSRKR